MFFRDIPKLPLILSAAFLPLSCKHVSSTGATSRASSMEVTSGDCNISNNTATFQNGAVKVVANLADGRASFFYADVIRVKNFASAVQLDKRVFSTDYSNHSCSADGDTFTIRHTGNHHPDMIQTFILNGGNRFLTRVAVQGYDKATNWIAPVMMNERDGLNMGGNTNDQYLLWVPFDNDMHVSYNAARLENNSGTSYEVGAFFNNVTRNGIVAGSVTHDTWKTGISYNGRNKLEVFGGATSKDFTHDVVPHGSISGNLIESPLVFVGYFPDWRDLMEEFGNVNAETVPKLQWNGGVPFGWNSWGIIQTKINYDKAIAVSDFVKNRLQNNSFSNNGVAYINLDSYWDNLNDGQLRDFVAHVHANGQKAGVYWAPFVDWGDDANGTMRNSDMRNGVAWNRDQKGNPIKLGGSHSLDPTNPGTQRRIDAFIDQFKSEGFDYIKLDFLSHASVESTNRFDPNVKTGIQAYNVGMKYIRDRIGGQMFIAESIAPLFPYQYAHSRRVSTDVFGAATGTGSSEYLLNSSSFGWWINGRLYNYNDPDQMVFQGFNSTENITRLLSAIVTGTVMFAGDDLTDAKAQNNNAYLLTNPRLNEIARMGKAFRPVEGNTGTKPSSVMVLHNGDRHFLAVFNFGGNQKYNIDLGRAGFDSGRTYQVIDQFDGTVSSARGNLRGPLQGKYSKMFELK
ncbi:MAG: hypothetical protein H7249_01505 [Chitinophagaceae bacterium]|nr:hypothetical protein [Oligoflexus sp.]